MPEIPFEELDRLLEHFDEGYKISHDEAYRRFSEVNLSPPNDLPADPFSIEYADRYLDLYRRISNRPAYLVQNERTELNVEDGVYLPYPYYTRSLRLASIHFLLMAKLFEIMELPAGSKILECGFGWGNTTLALAQLGYDVTALDIEERYCELVRRRSALLRVENIELINSDYFWVETTEKKFDAVVFFESFHHCWEFRRLLAALHRVLNPGGKIFFGAEPINNDFKVPWGVRLDGEALWVARRAGWMELGFRNDFFSELLSRMGWLGVNPHPHFWVASSKEEPIIMRATDPRLRSQIGTKRGNVLEVSAAAGRERQFAIFGPYIALPRGSYLVELRLSGARTVGGKAVFEVCCAQGEKDLHSHVCTNQELSDGSIKAEFTLEEGCADLEARLLVPGGFCATIDELIIISRS